MIIAKFFHAGVVMELDKVLSDILCSVDPTYSRLLSDILCSVDPTYSQFIRANGTIIVELKKALYWCVESAKLWYTLLDQTLVNDGFIKNPLINASLTRQSDYSCRIC